MNFIEYLGIALAPSLTLGLVIFLARNWFLERLKNSIKHEYDLALEKFKGELKHNNDLTLEKFKGDLKHDNDKSLENLKADLKSNNDLSLEKFKSELKHDNDKSLENLKADLKSNNDLSLEKFKGEFKHLNDLNLEEHKFQNEYRKKILNDLHVISKDYVEKIRNYVMLHNKFVINRELALGNVDEEFKNYTTSLENIGKTRSEISIIKYQLELLISTKRDSGGDLHDDMEFIDTWLSNELIENFVQCREVDFNSESYILFKERQKSFQNNIILLREQYLNNS